MAYTLRLSILLFAIALLLSACRPVTAPAPPAPVLDDATAAAIDAIVQTNMTDFPIPGFQVCVVKDGQVAYSKGFGLADVDTARPMTPQSIVIQASITKAFVAMAVMRLAEQGLIDLDAQVTDYLPYFTMADERYQAITVRMLLSHRSGLPDSPVYWPEPLDPALNPLEQAVRDLGEMELLFAPDDGWRYSGYGYSTLGAIIAAVTGQPFEEYMAAEWLTPLGMVNSTFVTDAVDPEMRVTLYTGYKLSRLRTQAPPTDARDASAGNLWSSCADMALWGQFIQNGGERNGVRLLQPESFEAMWAPRSESGWLLGPTYGPLVERYGLGWFLGAVDGRRLVGHMGDGDGINTQMLVAPDDGLAVFTMANWMDAGTAQGSFPASFAAMDVMKTLLGGE